MVNKIKTKLEAISSSQKSLAIITILATSIVIVKKVFSFFVRKK